MHSICLSPQNNLPGLSPEFLYSQLCPSMVRGQVPPGYVTAPPSAQGTVLKGIRKSVRQSTPWPKSVSKKSQSKVGAPGRYWPRMLRAFVGPVGRVCWSFAPTLWWSALVAPFQTDLTLPLSSQLDASFTKKSLISWTRALPVFDPSHGGGS